MRSANADVRGLAARREICLTLAASALLDASFDICQGDSDLCRERRVATNSFHEAYSLIRESAPTSVRVRFRWRIGHRSGRSEVEYSNLAYPLATSRFVLQFVRNLIRKEIARQLLRETFS